MKTIKNKSREKARKSLFNSESAGATVIAAVLLLSIIFTVLTVVRTEYVPQWKTDAEQSHMSEVQNDMAELKSTVDMVSLFTTSDQNSSAYGYSVTVPFSMGGGEIPVLEPSKSSGTLSVNTERCKIIITPERPSVTDTKTVECGGITYYSNNRQYMDQVFRYENGALILAQGNRSLMRQVPSFSIQKIKEGNYTVSIQAIEIKGDADSISSNTDASLRLTGLSARTIYDSNETGDIDNFTCTILTKYPDAWFSYLNETVGNSGLEYDTDYELDKMGSDGVYLSFHPADGKNLDRLYISQSVIQAELGAGGSLNYDDYGTGGGESLPGGSGNVMKLGKWYNFNKISDNGADSGVDLLPFKDYGTGFSFPANDPYDGVLNPYSKDDNVFRHNQPYTLDLTFGFNGYTEFESRPTSATIRMIYHYTFTNTNPGSIQVAGKSSDLLAGPKSNTDWCLYNKTTSINITDPSDLELDLQLNYQNSKYIEIDYLAVYLN